MFCLISRSQELLKGIICFFGLWPYFNEFFLRVGFLSKSKIMRSSHIRIGLVGKQKGLYTVVYGLVMLF